MLNIKKIHERSALGSLALRASRGDRHAEECFFGQCSHHLRPYVARWLRNEDIDDAVQDTMVVVMQRLRNNELAEPEKALYYAYSVARKISIAQIRKETRRKTNPDTPATEFAICDRESPEHEMIRIRMGRLLSDQIAKLSTPRDQEVLRRYYLEEEDRDVICQALALDSRQLSRVLYRSRERLREVVGAQDFGLAKSRPAS